MTRFLINDRPSNVKIVHKGIVKAACNKLASEAGMMYTSIEYINDDYVLLRNKKFISNQQS